MGITVNGVTSKGLDFNAGYAQIAQPGSISVNTTAVKQQLYLPYPNNTSLGTGSYTAECYFKYNVAQTSNNIFGKWTDLANAEYRFGFETAGQMLWTTVNNVGSNASYLTLTNPTTGSWHHFAAVNNAGQVVVYLDGVQQNSAGQNGTLRVNTTSSFQVGQGQFNNAFFTGSVSNVRITPGVAVYTSSFTPSRFQLTATQAANINGVPSLAITGSSTQLLLNTNLSVIAVSKDRSVNSYNLQNTGSIQPSLDNPFIPVNGSLEFGVQQSIQNSNAATILPSGSLTFTIETWVYATAVPKGVAPIVGDLLPNGGTNWWNLIVTSGQALGFRWVTAGGSTFSNYANAYTLPLNQWVYLTVVSNAGTMTLYANGVSYAIAGPVAVTARGGSTGILAMCQYNNANNYFQGYVNNLRIVNGVAVYTSNFTPPRQNLTAVPGTTLLLNTQYLGFSMLDSSGNNYTMLNTKGVKTITTTPF